MPPFLSVEPKVILAIIGFIALVALIVVLLCRHYKNADGSTDWGRRKNNFESSLLLGIDVCDFNEGHHRCGKEKVNYLV